MMQPFRRWSNVQQGAKPDTKNDWISTCDALKVEGCCHNVRN